MPREGANSIRILIADDHPVVRAGLAAMLATYPDLEVAGSVSDGRQAIALAATTDIILLDLRMPTMTGFEVLRELRQQKDAPRAIVLTTYESDEDIYQAIRAGAHGYLLKASSEEEMIEAIHAVHAGGRYFPPHIAARFADRVPRANLDSRQAGILDLIADGLTDEEVAQKLHTSVAGVWQHLNAIIETLESTSESESETAAPGRRATIADIARRAGVSMATVSRVLHNKGKHTEDTRRAVMRVVREYDFQLNSTAASLAMMRNTPGSEN
ncbi:response regulator [Acidobacterium sp. S8]|uniref:response regulator n=1 Tax=Acidobacterium sp. S8 TaxID=1641854 RepID=UPI00131E7E87|nr:response regulator [Acidobacterium sp. S8]